MSNIDLFAYCSLVVDGRASSLELKSAPILWIGRGYKDGEIGGRIEIGRDNVADFRPFVPLKQLLG